MDEYNCTIGVMAKKEIPGVKEVVRITENYFYRLYSYKDKSI